MARWRIRTLKTNEESILRNLADSVGVTRITSQPCQQDLRYKVVIEFSFDGDLYDLRFALFRCVAQKI